jgi:signal transduction histidine kinase
VGSQPGSLFIVQSVVSKLRCRQLQVVVCMALPSSDIGSGNEGRRTSGVNADDVKTLNTVQVTFSKGASIANTNQLNYQLTRSSIADAAPFGASGCVEYRPNIERKRAQLATRVSHAVLERRRLSRDLHDHAGQYLVSIMFQLAALERRIGDDATRNQLHELSAIVARFSDELRALCAGGGLAPPDDIVAALSDLSKTWAQQVGIAVKFEHSENDFSDADSAAAEAIFRISQEALTNVAKHALNASHVSLRLSGDATHVRLEIEDNGCVDQLDPRVQVVPDSPYSCGVLGMWERVSELGGQFAIEKIAGVGTRVSATIPIKAREHSASSVVQ